MAARLCRLRRFFFTRPNDLLDCGNSKYICDMRYKTLASLFMLFTFMVITCTSGNARASVTSTPMDNDVGWHCPTPQTSAFDQGPIADTEPFMLVHATTLTEPDQIHCSLGNLQSRDRRSKTIPTEYWCGGDSKASRYSKADLLIKRHNTRFNSTAYGKGNKRLS